MTRVRRRSTLLLSIVGVLTLAVVLALTVAPRGAVHRGSTSSRTSVSSALDRASAPRDCAGHTSSPPAADAMVIVGASYTYGTGASSRRLGYAPELARLLHRRARIYAVPGTGFLEAGRHGGGTFAERIARIPRGPQPGIVLIQGGRDDEGFAAHREQLAAEYTICLAHHRFASARIALLGPVAAAFPVSPRVQAVDAALRTACSREGALYLGALRERWMSPGNVRRFAGPVRGHPNDAGYLYIAHRAAADLIADGALGRGPARSRPQHHF